MVQHVDLAGDRDTGFKQVANRACDVHCRHISGWIVVLVDQEESRMVSLPAVKHHKVGRVQCQQYTTAAAREFEVDFVIGAG